MGGSTNVVLHCVEIARAAGFDLWADVLSQREFNGYRDDPGSWRRNALTVAIASESAGDVMP